MKTKKINWTPELLEKMARWKADNQVSNEATAKHFGYNPKTSFSALQRAKKPGTKTYVLKKKKQKFVDVAHIEPEGKVAIIVCPANQVKSVLAGLQ
jgi:hypothetical protein